MQTTEQDVRTSDCHPSHYWDDDYLDSLPYYITSVDLSGPVDLSLNEEQWAELTRIASPTRVTKSFTEFLNVFLLTSLKNWSGFSAEMKPCHT